MYPEGAQRLVRRDWAAIGTDYLKGPPENWTPQMVGEATKGLAVGLQQLMEEMSLLLGSKGIPVLHGYPVKFEDTLLPGSTDAVLEVANYPIPPQTNEDALDDITNGFAFKVTHGKVCFAGPVCFDGSVTGIAGNAGVVCWGKVKHNGVHADGTVGHTLGTIDTWDSTVTVTPVTDKSGATPTGEADRTVYAWRDRTTDPNFRLNDVIPFVKDENNIGITYAGRDKKIGATDERYDISDPTTSPDYTATNGHRGWHLANGSDGTQDRRGQVSYGWSGAGAFTTTGADVPLAFTGSATDDEIVAAISDHAVHNHAVDKDDVTASMTVDDQVTAITVSSTATDIESIPGTATDPLVHHGTINDPGHVHALVSGGGTFNTANNSAAQAHAGSGNDAAVTATVVQPAGQVAVILQRIN